MHTETTGTPPCQHTPAKNAAQQLRECLRVPDVASFLGCGVATVWRRTKDDPTFPKPIKLSERVTVWKLSELKAWVDSRRQAATA